MEEYPAYNFGAVAVFEIGPAMHALRNKMALGSRFGGAARVARA